MLHNSIIMAQQDRYLNMALPLVNCLKLVRGFAVWFVDLEVCVEFVEFVCGSYKRLHSVALARWCRGLAEPRTVRFLYWLTWEIMVGLGPQFTVTFNEVTHLAPSRSISTLLPFFIPC
eukprot:SAG31_NODE_272_length_18690_cov_14.520785_16_plen_118_part_00